MARWDDYKALERQARQREIVSSMVQSVEYTCDLCGLATGSRPIKGRTVCFECQFRTQSAQRL